MQEEDEEPPPEDTPAERLVRRLWRVLQVLLRTELVQKLKKAVNPPVTAVFAGEEPLHWTAQRLLTGRFNCYAAMQLLHITQGTSNIHRAACLRSFA